MKKKKYTLFDVINTALVILITITILYPLYFCVIASVSEPSQVALGNTLLWVKEFTLESYRYVFREDSLWRGYKNTIIYTFFGTLYNLVLTIPAAYVLTKKYLPFRGIISWFFFMTMYFGGGMIPTYLLMKNLGLVNNPLAMIVGAGVSCYNLIVTRQYFSNNIPDEIYEAARIDGASEFRCFAQIAFPLSKAIIAVMALYYGVGHWNSFYNALIYLLKPKYFPLQLVLRELLFKDFTMEIENAESFEVAERLIKQQQAVLGVRYGIMLFSSLPLLIAYPFIQKYFVKGVTIGGVKG